jgi:hypothetical protein
MKRFLDSLSARSERGPHTRQAEIPSYPSNFADILVITEANRRRAELLLNNSTLAALRESHFSILLDSE